MRRLLQLVRTAVWADFVVPLPAASRTGNSGMCFDGLCRRSSRRCGTPVRLLSARHVCHFGYDTAYHQMERLPFIRKSHRPLSPLRKERAATGRTGGLKKFRNCHGMIWRGAVERPPQPSVRAFLFIRNTGAMAATALHRSRISRLCALHADVDAFLPIMLKNIWQKAEPCRREGPERAIRNCTVSAVRRGGKRRRRAMVPSIARCRVPV